MEKLFPADVLSKRERVERALNLRPVDRVPIHEQLCNSPAVVSHYAKRHVEGFDYGLQEIGDAVRATLDCAFPMVAPCGLGLETTEDGFVYKNENWTRWHISRPFTDEDGAAQWLRKRLNSVRRQLKEFDADLEREQHHREMRRLQAMVGDTVLVDWSCATGFCDVFDKMGLEIFSYFIYEYEDLMVDYMEAIGTLNAKKARAVFDYELSPMILIAEDFCTVHGPIFSSAFLRKTHYPWIKAVADEAKAKGLKVIYHTDGNLKRVIPELLDCNVDGFYCLERNCGMHIEQLALEYPDVIWMGGVDGVNTMEFGTADDVTAEVKRIIEKSNALQRGGIFIDSSSEINPPIPLENFQAMIQACDTFRNHHFII